MLHSKMYTVLYNVYCTLQSTIYNCTIDNICCIIQYTNIDTLQLSCTPQFKIYTVQDNLLLQFKSGRN